MVLECMSGVASLSSPVSMPSCSVSKTYCSDGSDEPPSPSVPRPRSGTAGTLPVLVVRVSDPAATPSVEGSKETVTSIDSPAGTVAGSARLSVREYAAAPEPPIVAPVTVAGCCPVLVNRTVPIDSAPDPVGWLATSRSVLGSKEAACSPDGTRSR